MYDSIKTLYETVMGCTACRLSQQRRNVVFGEGNLHADVMFIGEGPGAREDEQGRQESCWIRCLPESVCNARMCILQT